jgi:hypothetical protein
MVYIGEVAVHRMLGNIVGNVLVASVITMLVFKFPQFFINLLDVIFDIFGKVS